jgi:hypothetical protein
MTMIFADSSSIVSVVNIINVIVGCAAAAQIVWSVVERRRRLIERATLRAQLIGCVGLIIIGWRVLLPLPVWLNAIAMLLGAGLLVVSTFVMQRGKHERRARNERLERLEELEEILAERIMRE